MISFLLDEGVITIGTLSGLFTTSLLNSFKKNIIDPSIENIIPSHKLDNETVKQTPGEQKSGFSDLFPIPIGGGSDHPYPPSTVVKWQTFLKDFITWLVIMFFLYLFWKKVIVPKKMSKMPNFGQRM
jgi:large-conductance mechanosensitive channel